MIGVGTLLGRIRSRRPGEMAAQVEDMLPHAAAYKIVKNEDYSLAGFLGRVLEAFKEAEQDPLKDTCYRPEIFYPAVRDLVLANEDQLERCLCDCLRMAARNDIKRQGGGNLDGYNWEFLEAAAYTFTDVERFEGLRNPEKDDDRVDRWLGTFNRFKQQLTTARA